MNFVIVLGVSFGIGLAALWYLKHRTYFVNLNVGRLEKQVLVPQQGFAYEPAPSYLHEQFFEHIRGDDKYLTAKSQSITDFRGAQAYRVPVKFNDARWLDKQVKQHRQAQKAELESDFKALITN